MLPVVCLAHGSRHPGADATVAEITGAVAALTGRAPEEVAPAHLDFSPLTLTTAARLLAAHGHREAVVVPLLFTTAFHMTHDVPEAMAEATAETGVDLHLTPAIGTADDIAALLSSRIAARARACDHLVLYSVGSSVDGANERVADLARDVGRRLGVPGHALVATGGVGTGPDVLVDHVTRVVGEGARHLVVEPLFISPGRLWDMAVEAVSDVSGHVDVGEPLSTAIAPVIAERAAGR